MSEIQEKVDEFVEYENRGTYWVAIFNRYIKGTDTFYRASATKAELEMRIGHLKRNNLTSSDAEAALANWPA